MVAADSIGILGDGMLAKTSTPGGLVAKKNQDDEFWVADSGETEHTTSSAANLGDCHTTSTNDHVETADESLLAIAGYDQLHLDFDEGTGNFTGTTGDLELQRVVHGPQLGNHNLFSVTKLSKSLHAPLLSVPCSQPHQTTAGIKVTLVLKAPPRARP